MACEATGCKDFLMQNKSKFGITEGSLRTECLDLCTENVRCIASRQIRDNIPLPSISGFLNSCTGLVDTASGIDTKFASLRVTHAKEELVGCDTNNPGVRVIVKGQVIVRTIPCDPRCPPSYMAIPMELVNEVIFDFYSTKDGCRIENLKNELPFIDGSCMVVNLSCKISREVSPTCSRYVAIVKGSVVDKLWKYENIWVEGIRPYPAPSLTVCEKFDRDFCTGGEDMQAECPHSPEVGDCMQDD
ncbi:MAG: hypothetical protein RR273_03620 [Oscillospiraceae bacterium]